MKSQKYLIGIIVLIIFGGFFIFSNSEQNKDISKDNPSNPNANEITLSYKDYNYYPQNIYVKLNEPVKIYLDNSVRGCFRDFTIRELGVRKYLKSTDDFVEFTPSKKGTFTFACSMGMGTGKITVE